MHPRTTEAIISISEGIYKVRTIRRNRVELRWCVQTAHDLTMAVSEYMGGVAPEGAPTVPRDFDMYGFTGGCPGCGAVQKGDGARGAHTEACRRQMEGLMEADPRRQREGGIGQFAHGRPCRGNRGRRQPRGYH